MNKYENLSQFLGICFNQDWEEIINSNNPDDAIKDFCTQESSDFLKLIVSELGDFIKTNPNELEIRKFLLFKMDCSYDPVEDYKSRLEWLNHVKEKILFYIKQKGS